MSGRDGRGRCTRMGREQGRNDACACGTHQSRWRGELESGRIQISHSDWEILVATARFPPSKSPSKSSSPRGTSGSLLFGGPARIEERPEGLTSLEELRMTRLDCAVDGLFIGCSGVWDPISSSSSRMSSSAESSLPICPPSSSSSTSLMWSNESVSSNRGILDNGLSVQEENRGTIRVLSQTGEPRVQLFLRPMICVMSERRRNGNDFRKYYLHNATKPGGRSNVRILPPSARIEQSRV